MTPEDFEARYERVIRGNDEQEARDLLAELVPEGLPSRVSWMTSTQAARYRAGLLQHFPALRADPGSAT